MQGTLTLNKRAPSNVRATSYGHKRPDIATVQASWVIHTATASYALDEEGFCLYVVAPDGTTPAAANRCRGAQYVACFDRVSEEGITSQLRIGAQALFIGRGTGERMALMRTGPVTRIDSPDPASEPAPRALGAGDIKLPWHKAKPVNVRETRLGLPVVQLPAEPAESSLLE